MLTVASGQELYARARQRIPGGTQLLSKRPEQFLPDRWPAYYSRCQGAQVWDLDGCPYLDMSYNGIGSCVLGAADADVDAAVSRAIAAGTMSTLNCPEEVELADVLCEMHPWAQKVRYARCGGEAMAIAVRIARSATGRDRVAFCGYHGWHDWYLAANLSEPTQIQEPRHSCRVGSSSDAPLEALDGHLLPGLSPSGVPRGLAGTALPFHYNQIEQLRGIVARCGRELAAIVMEPVRSTMPDSGFLDEVRCIAGACGAVLIFDEITAAWRICDGGSHLKLGVTPDMAVFAKAMSNGYPMAAVIGNARVMDAAQDTFISSTYWTERIGPTAALATIAKFRRCDVARHLDTIGRQVQELWRSAADQAGLPISVGGIPPLAHFSIETPQPAAARTLFTQLMLDRGILATESFYATFAHNGDHLAQYADALEDVFAEIARAVDDGTVESRLEGPIAHSGFSRLT